MTIQQIIAAGDRVEFKKYVAECPVTELIPILAMVGRARVQDFNEIVMTELHRRKSIK